MFKILPMCGCQKLSLSGNRRKSFFHFFCHSKEDVRFEFEKKKKKYRGYCAEVKHPIKSLICLLWWIKIMIGLRTMSILKPLWVWEGQQLTKIGDQTNATNMSICPLMQAIWGCIWKHIVGKSNTNATSVNLHALM